MSHLVTLIPILLKLSIALTVFSFGLGVKPGDLTLLFRNPGLLVRCLLAMSVVMPLVAWALVVALDLKPPVALALATLSLSPIPPLLPKRELKSGAGASYVFSLLVTAAVLAMAQVPAGVEAIGWILGRPAHMSPAAIAQIMLTAVLAPLAAGMIVRIVSVAFAERLARPASLVGATLLAIGAIPVLIVQAPLALSLIGDGTLVAISAFIVIGLAVGHLLGGPKPSDRVVLALATASRHPGVALAIAAANAPQQKLVMSAVVLYLVANAILSLAYLAWVRRRGARAHK